MYKKKNGITLVATQVAVLFAFCLLFSGCIHSKKAVASTAPTTFVRSADAGGWSTILIRDGLSYDKAFDEMLDVVAKRYEMDMISKEGGYGRSKWIYTNITTNGVTEENYKTRIIFKFSADKTKVDIKTEAQWKSSDNGWLIGYDTELLQTLKQDVEGSIGRTVR